MTRWQRESCPACGSEHYGYTPDNGVGFCFVCGHWQRDNAIAYKPKVRSAYIDEIRNFYAQAAEYYHNSLDGVARQFLIRRGFTDDTIERFKIGYCPIGRNPMYRDKMAKESGLSVNATTGFLADRITFPYLYDETTITDIRGRSINPADELRYKSPFNDVFFRGADYPYNYHLRNNKRIILTEGEIKADIASQIQYPAMALPGIMSWRPGVIFDTDYTLIFDSQRRMVNVRYAIHRIVAKIVAAGINEPLIGTLPLFGKEKQDIDGFILEHGTEAFRQVIDTALPYHEWAELQRF